MSEAGWQAAKSKLGFDNYQTVEFNCCQLSQLRVYAGRGRTAQDSERPMGFENRSAAGQRLAAALAPYRERAPVVLALPRGGVPVAAEVASALHVSLDLISVRKIRVPSQPWLVIGAVADGLTPITVRNDYLIRFAGVSEAGFNAMRDDELAEIERRRRRYLGGRLPVNVSGRTVIVIDDLVATGATTRTALQALRAQAPKELVLAVPVAARETLEQLHIEADTTVCLESPAWFVTVGAIYRDFRQVTDPEVIEILARFSDEQSSGVGQ
jgi:putative phosphoribosyl transferase